jgi:hypothetical protein
MAALQIAIFLVAACACGTGAGQIKHLKNEQKSRKKQLLSSS